MGDFEQVEAIHAGKRLAVDWTPWMGDWFVSSSPRNGNSNAEAPWEQWVDLALRILDSPLTKLSRPEHHRPLVDGDLNDSYSGEETLQSDQIAEALNDRAGVSQGTTE